MNGVLLAVAICAAIGCLAVVVRQRALRREMERFRALSALRQAENARDEEQRDLLMREMNHRAKNLLTVVQAVVKLTRADDQAGYADAVMTRIMALDRAHTLLSANGWADTCLRVVIMQELAAHAAGRTNCDGPLTMLTSAAVQPMAIVLHELATNSIKYGSLSTETGTLTLRWRFTEDEFLLQWREDGGPPILAPSTLSGFGTRVIDASISQLGGRVVRDWPATGLVCDIALPLSRVSAVIEEQAAMCGTASKALSAPA